ncbi:hypothetical protein KC960_05045 [Candidatus Saccharibacteria bacterium]|nr:hypothetical protein [Candidatus Saccharibacteria bacterium]
MGLTTIPCPACKAGLKPFTTSGGETVNVMEHTAGCTIVNEEVNRRVGHIKGSINDGNS